MPADSSTIPVRGRRLRSILGALLLLSTWSCVFEGGGSDTETLEALLLDAHGRPAAGAEVKLIPSGYDPSRPGSAAIRTARTGGDGRFAFPEAPEPGTYNLIATAAGEAGPASTQSARVDRNVPAGPIGQALFAPNLPSDFLPDTLRLDWARVFYIYLHGETYQAADSGQVWFRGTDILVRCGVDTAKVESIPWGLDSLLIESRSGWHHDYLVTNTADSLMIKASRESVLCERY